MCIYISLSLYVYIYIHIISRNFLQNTWQEKAPQGAAGGGIQVNTI